jgi:hypothetical protein
MVKPVRGVNDPGVRSQPMRVKRPAAYDGNLKEIEAR